MTPTARDPRLTLVELAELDELEPGFLEPHEWADAIASTLEVPPSRKPTCEPRRERRSPRRLVREERVAKVAKEHAHEGVRRAVDPAYAKHLFDLSPDVPHPVVPLKWILRIARPFLRLNLRNCWVALQGLTPREAMVALLAGFCEAVGTPCAFRGGNDNARGFGSGGSEWPQLGALVAGADYRSDTTLANWFRDLEEELLAYRKPRLEKEPIVDPKTGKQHRHRFGRNDVYLARAALVRWYRNPLIAPWVEYVRAELTPLGWTKTSERGRKVDGARVPGRTARHSDLSDQETKQVWIETAPGRRWRKSTYSYRDAIELTRAERVAKGKRRHEAALQRAQRLTKWSGRARRRADRLTEARELREKRFREEASRRTVHPSEVVTDPLSAQPVQTVPITPPLTLSGEIRAGAPAEKDGPNGPAHPGAPPVGQRSFPRPSWHVVRPAPLRETAIEGRFQGGNIASAVPSSTADPPAPTSRSDVARWLDEHGPAFRRTPPAS